MEEDSEYSDSFTDSESDSTEEDSDSFSDSDDEIPEPKRPRTTAATPTSNPGGATTSTALGKVDQVQKGLKSVPNQPTGAVSVSTPVGNGKSVCMSLLDLDLLDCPICFLPLSSPVYQCENGHMACASCTTKLKNKCSSCSLPIGKIRCRPIEKVIESVRVTCQYNAFGCAEMLRRSNKVAHEKTCKYVPCSCPSIGCNFVGSSKHLYDHFALEHKDLSQQFNFGSVISIKMKSTDKHVILQERSEGELFVVNRCRETFGSLFNVVCVAPSSSLEQRCCEITADVGADSIILRSSVEMVSKWTAQTRPAKMSVAVSSNVSTTQLKLKVVIRKLPKKVVTQPTQNNSFTKKY